jgi:hypothetical protein
LRIEDPRKKLRRREVARAEIVDVAGGGVHAFCFRTWMAITSFWISLVPS